MPEGTTLTVYHDEADMLNGSNGGSEGLGHIISPIVNPERVEEIGLLVPQVELDTVPAQPTQPM